MKRQSVRNDSGTSGGIACHGLVALAFLVLGGLACVPEDQRTDTIDAETWEEARTQYTPELRAQLDSGNVAYRSANYETALVHYERALEMEEDVAAAWFGVYMANHALGNLEVADSALERARALLPGASLLRENEPE
jgi:tetratricopeptide (TPR) repeat protein